MPGSCPSLLVPEPHASELISLAVLCVQSGQCGLGARPWENEAYWVCLKKDTSSSHGLATVYDMI